MSRQIQTRAASEIQNTGFIPGALFILKAVFISYAFSVVLLFLLSILATFQAFSDTVIQISVNTITAIGVFLCGFMAGRHFSGKGLVFGAVSGIVYALILCVIGIIVSAEANPAGSAFTAIAIGIICGAVGGITGINTKRTRRR